MKTLLPAMDVDSHIHFMLEYSEKTGESHVTLLWHGNGEDPLQTLKSRDASDPMIAILRSCAREIVFEPGEKNDALRFRDV